MALDRLVEFQEKGCVVVLPSLNDLCLFFFVFFISLGGLCVFVIVA